MSKKKITTITEFLSDDGKSRALVNLSIENDYYIALYVKEELADIRGMYLTLQAAEAAAEELVS